MNFFTKTPVAIQTSVNQAVSNLQKQVDDLFDMEEALHDDIDTQRSIIQAAQNRVAISQAEIEKSQNIRKALSAAIQATV